MTHAFESFVKVSGPNLDTYLEYASIFEWGVVMCRSKNGHKKDACLLKIGLQVELLLTNVGSVVNIMRETYIIVQ